MATEYCVSCWLELESVVGFLEKLFCPLSPAEESWDVLNGVIDSGLNVFIPGS